MAATISLTTKFNIDTGKFNFTDTSNYAAQASPDLGIKGTLKVTGPSGLVYENAAFSTPASATADITTAGSYINNSISLPLDASGDVQEGSYTIEYKVYVTSGTDAGVTFDTLSSTFTYTFDAPSIAITQVVDCINAVFTSTDSTVYVVDGITPTTTRTHAVLEVADPTRTNLSNTNAANTVVYPNLYTGNYKTTISTLCVYAFTGYSVSVTITANATYNVTCSSPCDVYCGISEVWESYLSYQAAGDIKAAANASALFTLLTSLYKLYEMAVNCGETADANTYLAKIISVGNFSSSCCTTTGQVVPLVVKGDVYKTTSATSIAIGLGIKTFTVPAGLAYQAGTTTRAQDAANPSNYVEGPIASYSSTSLALSSINYGGSGTKSNWYINIGS
jgi:hypothetical protein